MEPRRSTPVRRPSPIRRSPPRSPTWSARPPRPACRVAPQGTGHGAPPLAGRLEDAVLLRTSAMTELRVDAERRTARVGAGVRWGDVVERAGARGPRGPAHLQPRRRRRRLLARRRAELVRPARRPAVQRAHRRRAGARRRHVRPGHRRPTTATCCGRPAGAAGGFGVVTALEFDLLPVPRVVRRDARLGLGRTPSRVLRAWSEWAGEAPETVTSVARLFQAPDVPWLPADVRGRQPRHRRRRRRSGTPTRPRALLAPLRALRPGDRHLRRRARRLRRPAAARPGGPDRGLRQQRPARRPARARGRGAGRRRRAGLGVGAALRRAAPARRSAVPPGARAAVRWTAWTARSSCSAWALDTGAGWAAVREDAHRVMDALQPWATGSAYLLMADEEVDERRGWPAASWQRLGGGARGGRPARAVRAAALARPSSR